MAFSSKRGRPALNRPKNDTGTKELAARHARGLTLEPLDLCLKRGVISEAQHRAGIHFRWLHTLRFGAPTVSAYDAANLGGKVTGMNNDLAWKAEREREYEEAVVALKHINAYACVSNLCIFGRYPKFLFPTRDNEEEMQLLQEGLDMLERKFFIEKRKVARG
jgi:hypothetical protein